MFQNQWQENGLGTLYHFLKILVVRKWLKHATQYLQGKGITAVRLDDLMMSLPLLNFWF